MSSKKHDMQNGLPEGQMSFRKDHGPIIIKLFIIKAKNMHMRAPIIGKFDCWTDSYGQLSPKNQSGA